MGIMFYAIIAMALIILWTLADIIPNFALYDGTAGSTSSYCRTGWWLAIDWCILLIVFVSSYFGLTYAMESGTIEKGVKKTNQWCGLSIFCLVLGICSNITQIALTGVEMTGCSSNLCKNNYWALACLQSILAILVFLKSVIIWRFVVYRLNLDAAMNAGKVDMNLTEPRDVEEPAQVKSRIVTPLLAQYNNGGRRAAQLHRLK